MKEVTLSTAMQIFRMKPIDLLEAELESIIKRNDEGKEAEIKAVVTDCVDNNVVTASEAKKLFEEMKLSWSEIMGKHRLYDGYMVRGEKVRSGSLLGKNDLGITYSITLDIINSAADKSYGPEKALTDIEYNIASAKESYDAEVDIQNGGTGLMLFGAAEYLSMYHEFIWCKEVLLAYIEEKSK